MNMSACWKALPLAVNMSGNDRYQHCAVCREASEVCPSAEADDLMSVWTMLSDILQPLQRPVPEGDTICSRCRHLILQVNQLRTQVDTLQALLLVRLDAGQSSVVQPDGSRVVKVVVKVGSTKRVIRVVRHAGPQPLPSEAPVESQGLITPAPQPPDRQLRAVAPSSVRIKVKPCLDGSTVTRLAPSDDSEMLTVTPKSDSKVSKGTPNGGPKVLKGTLMGSSKASQVTPRDHFTERQQTGENRLKIMVAGHTADPNTRSAFSGCLEPWKAVVDDPDTADDPDDPDYTVDPDDPDYADDPDDPDTADDPDDPDTADDPDDPDYADDPDDPDYAVDPDAASDDSRAASPAACPSAHTALPPAVMKRRSWIEPGDQSTARSATPSPERSPAASPAASTAAPPPKDPPPTYIREEEHSRCGVCDLKLETRAECREHITQAHRAKKVYFCPLCPEALTARNALESHELSTHADSPIKPYGCGQCPETFPTPIFLRRHKEEEHGSIMLPCMFCGLTFRRREDLYKHMEDHVSDWGDQPPYACRKCGKSFTKQVRWRKHMLTHSSKRDRRYQCPLCVKTFLTAGHLDVHIRSHTREPLRCDRCERTFTSSVWLQKHAETCSATANFHCDICGRQFGRKSRLTAHLRSSHTGENLFLCEDCGARFSLRANMIRHINDVHRNLKLHQCPVCEKVFSRRGILKYHLASAHAEDRGQRLRVQKRSHPAKRSFTCPECGVKFAWRAQLKAHMKRENHSAPPEDDDDPPPPPEGAQLTTAEEDEETTVIKEEMIETRIKEEETNEEETRGEEPMLEGETVEADKVKRVPDVGVGKSEAGQSGMGCPPSWVDDDISFR